ncbi:hypothetical protein GDO78_022808 [Eleutherodactylus coqui]|uniref:Secreted protein n=1 Tax=Eleutherodactylus coqui TaxID=57060 RepID=A0A8J6EFV0_ELECQ|nr:hypothetical protein GDO78_022808 [Eleutherodactylus coqui]
MWFLLSCMPCDCLHRWVQCSPLTLLLSLSCCLSSPAGHSEYAPCRRSTSACPSIAPSIRPSIAPSIHRFILLLLGGCSETDVYMEM